MLFDNANAYNRLNRKVALQNIQITFNICHRNPARLFIAVGHEISSQEGTTQRDPLAMPLYPLSTTVIIDQHIKYGLLMMHLLQVNCRTSMNGTNVWKKKERGLVIFLMARKVGSY